MLRPHFMLGVVLLNLHISGKWGDLLGSAVGSSLSWVPLHL